MNLTDFTSDGYSVFYSESVNTRIDYTYILSTLRSSCDMNSLICLGSGSSRNTLLDVVGCANCYQVTTYTANDAWFYSGTAWWYFSYVNLIGKSWRFNSNSPAYFGFSSNNSISFDMYNCDYTIVNNPLNICMRLNTDSGGCRFGIVLPGYNPNANLKKYILKKDMLTFTCPNQTTTNQPMTCLIQNYLSNQLFRIEFSQTQTTYLTANQMFMNVSNTFTASGDYNVSLTALGLNYTLYAQVAVLDLVTFYCPNETQLYQDIWCYVTLLVNLTSPILYIDDKTRVYIYALNSSQFNFTKTYTESGTFSINFKVMNGSLAFANATFLIQVDLACK